MNKLRINMGKKKKKTQNCRIWDWTLRPQKLGNMCRKYSCKPTVALEIYPLAGSTDKPIGIPAPREVPSLVIRVFLYITSPCSFRTYTNIELVRACNIELKIDCQIKGRKPKSTRLGNHRKFCLTLQSTLFSTPNSLSFACTP